MVSIHQKENIEIINQIRNIKTGIKKTKDFQETIHKYL
jgi:hypothetical protein